MTIYLAIDPVTGTALPDGEIVGIAETVAGLRAQGFANNPYSNSNQRRPSIDETDSSVWNNDCVPGWYYVGSAVQIDPPMSALETMKQRYRRVNEAAERLSEKLAVRAAAGWHSPALVAKGNAWLYHAAFEASYLIALNSTISNAEKTNFAVGGLAILNSILAENDSETLYNSIEPLESPTGPQLMVILSTGAPRTFATAMAIEPGSNGYPNAPTSAQLGNGSWVEQITL